MNVTSKRHHNRVIIGATCFADADGAITMAAILARKLQGEILGLLVEDDAILRYANFPTATTMTFKSGLAQSVTPEIMAKAFQRDANIFERELTKAAKQVAVRSSFEHQRGQLMPLLQSIASTGDIIFLGYQRTSVAKGKIIFINETPENESPLLELGMEIAHEMHLTLQTINLVKTTQPAPKSDINPNSTVAVHDKSDLLEYLHKENPTAVIIAPTPENSLDLYKILGAARCPLIAYLTNNASISATSKQE